MRIFTTVSFIMSALLVLAIITPKAASAQVAQWNHVVTDAKLQKSMLRAIREVSIDYIDDLDKADIAGAVAFVDTQLDYPLQLTSTNFRHNNLNALQAKAAYVMRYQAKSSAGVDVTLAPPAAFAGLTGGYGGEPGNVRSSGHGEIPGDGAMMICPINKSGLKFMSGVISIASLDANDPLRAFVSCWFLRSCHGSSLPQTSRLPGGACRHGRDIGSR
ncbi:MAG: hypothetical protein ABJN26_14005 [Stappiaceae bacterium]